MERALIICDSPKGTEFYASFLRENGYDQLKVFINGEEARQWLIDHECEVCLINAPLHAENGTDLAMDIAVKNVCQVILTVKTDRLEEVTEQVEDYGIITVARPISKQLLWSALKLAHVAQRRIELARKETRKVEQSLEDLKAVSRAKLLLISYEGMSEEEAHKYIERTAMDERITRTEVAQRIIDRYA